MVSKICNALLSVILIVVILVAGALTVPKWLGMEIFGVLSGSMEPAYPVGSVLYVADVDATEIKVNDPISFYLGGTETVATHRVIGIDAAGKTFQTKGDNNPAPDSQPISFEHLIGKPVLCIPMLGTLAAYIETAQGKVWALMLLGFVVVLWILAAVTEKKDGKKKKDANEDAGEELKGDPAESDVAAIDEECACDDTQQAE